MVIADETDAAAMAKWEHYKAGTDLEALAWRDAQAEDDPNQDPYSQAHKRRTLGIDKLPTNQGVLVGSYASVARMLDELADRARRAGRDADLRRLRHRHGAVRHPHPAADALPGTRSRRRRERFDGHRLGEGLAIDASCTLPRRRTSDRARSGHDGRRRRRIAALAACPGCRSARWR